MTKDRTVAVKVTLISGVSVTHREVTSGPNEKGVTVFEYIEAALAGQISTFILPAPLIFYKTSQLSHVEVEFGRDDDDLANKVIEDRRMGFPTPATTAS